MQMKLFKSEIRGYFLLFLISIFMIFTGCETTVTEFVDRTITVTNEPPEPQVLGSYSTWARPFNSAGVVKPGDIWLDTSIRTNQGTAVLFTNSEVYLEQIRPAFMAGGLSTVEVDNMFGVEFGSEMYIAWLYHRMQSTEIFPLGTTHLVTFSSNATPTPPIDHPIVENYHKIGGPTFHIDLHGRMFYTLSQEGEGNPFSWVAISPIDNRTYIGRVAPTAVTEDFDPAPREGDLYIHIMNEDIFWKYESSTSTWKPMDNIPTKFSEGLQLYLFVVSESSQAQGIRSFEDGGRDGSYHLYRKERSFGVVSGLNTPFANIDGRDIGVGVLYDIVTW